MTDQNWQAIMREAELDRDDATALEPFMLALASLGSTALPRTAGQRLANRIWLEGKRRAAGSLTRRATDLLSLGRAQVRLFSVGFWLVSFAIMLAGTAVEAAGLDPERVLAFYLAAPLLAYTATAAAFRGQHHGPYELELATPVSPRELLLVRLLVILGYDIAIGVIASVPLAVTGQAMLGPLTINWLSPLLLATGATLLLASWVRVEQAGAVVYAGWVVIVVGAARLSTIPMAMLPTLDLVMALIGIVLMSLVVLSMPSRFSLPSRGAAT